MPPVPRPRVAKLVAVALLPVLLAAAGSGCALLGIGQPAVAVNPDGTPLTPRQQQQRALDTVREQYGLALDVVEPLIANNVLTDAPTLAVIRAINKQMRGDPARGTKGDIADAQALIESGNTVSASFVIDRAAGAAASILRIREQHKGRP